jgi:hypothetical protein
LPHHEGRDRTGDSTGEEQPVKQKLDSERRDWWNNDSGETEDDKNYTLDQKKPPKRMPFACTNCVGAVW